MDDLFCNNSGDFMLAGEKTLSALIKEINMMGGKQMPKVADTFYRMNQELKECKTLAGTDLFKQATFELYRAGNELSFIRRRWIKTFMLGFTAALCFVGILTAILASSGVLLAVHYG
jgi:hypothetical protein